MSALWQRRREPDAVPTPTAVALSDFCRRAQSPASASEVREALALISEDDEFRLREITDHDPKARPLGPFAVIDVMQGTAHDVAVRRQQVGYYDVVRELAKVRSDKTVVVSVPPEPEPSAAVAPRAAASARAGAGAAGTKRQAKAAEPSIAEKIAPKKREPAPPEPAEPSSHPFAKLERHEPPQRPRGRFAQLAANKRPGGELFDESSRDLLDAMLEQHRHRFGMHRALAHHYSGRAGTELGVYDIESAMQRHGLFDKLEKQERELLLSAYAEHRGESGRVAHALGLSPAELQKLVKAAKVEREVEELRERFRREALSPKGLGNRLNLLGRTKYLSDLGIARRFQQSLMGDLRSLLKDTARDADSFDALVELASRRYSLEPELLRRTLEKLGLEDEFKKRWASSPESHP